jgi:type IV pilus assembly protein PilM
MVRVLDMPAVPGKELRSALRYEIGELLPIPLEQAVFDFAPLGPGRPKGDGGETSQVLVTVAQKDIVWDEIAAAKRGGLRVRAVDASALALVRAVSPPSDPEALDAVVSLGAHLAVVALRQGGTPRFVRTATVGSETDATAKVGAGMRLAPAPARPDNNNGAGPRPETVVEEVRSSIEFFLSHAHGLRLERVQLTGGGALMDGMVDRLSTALGIPVVAATVVPECQRSKLGLDEVQFKEASQRWTTAVGLALWGSEGGRAPSLLPPEIDEKSKQRRIIAFAGVGVLVVAGGLGYLSHGRVQSTDRLKSQATAEQQQASNLAAEVVKLGSLSQAQGEVLARRELAVQALSKDVDWVHLDKTIGNALPQGASLSSISFTNVGPNASSDYVGAVTVTMTTKGGLPAEATVVRALTAVPELGAVWVSESTVATSAPAGTGASKTTTPTTPPGLVTFQVSADVTTDALSNRASELPGGQP